MGKINKNTIKSKGLDEFSFLMTECKNSAACLGLSNLFLIFKSMYEVSHSCLSYFTYKKFTLGKIFSEFTEHLNSDQRNRYLKELFPLIYSQYKGNNIFLCFTI